MFPLSSDVFEKLDNVQEKFCLILLPLIFADQLVFLAINFAARIGCLIFSSGLRICINCTLIRFFITTLAALYAKASFFTESPIHHAAKENKITHLKNGITIFSQSNYRKWNNSCGKKN